MTVATELWVTPRARARPDADDRGRSPRAQICMRMRVQNMHRAARMRARARDLLGSENAMRTAHNVGPTWLRIVHVRTFMIAKLKLKL